MENNSRIELFAILNFLFDRFRYITSYQNVIISFELLRDMKMHLSLGCHIAAVTLKGLNLNVFDFIFKESVVNPFKKTSFTKQLFSTITSQHNIHFDFFFLMSLRCAIY